MATYRTISLKFWEDLKITDDFTPEDRYFYLYLLTNTHTNLCGCYEISISQMARELGYSKETVSNLLYRFKNAHKVVDYCDETKELLIIKWHKYNWTKSPKLIASLRECIPNIKCKKFADYIVELIENDTVSIPYPYPMDTSVTVTDNNIILNNNISIKDNNIDIIKDIIDYLNNKLGTKYKYTTKDTKQHINARLQDGYTVDDFYTVIDKKVADWKDNPDMSDYLRPQTLFSTKFEGYLNQVPKKPKNVFDEWRTS